MEQEERDEEEIRQPSAPVFFTYPHPIIFVLIVLIILLILLIVFMVLLLLLLLQSSGLQHLVAPRSTLATSRHGFASRHRRELRAG